VLALVVFFASAWARPTAADPRKPGDAARDIDSEHLFGFTEGSDIGERGEREAEADSTGRFGKGGGSYAALSTAFEAKYTATDYFRVGMSATLAAYNLSGVPGFDDRNAVTVQDIAGDLRYRMLDREKAPIGLTFAFEPHWGFADNASGAPADRLGAKFSLLADSELVADRLYGALNLLYEPEQTRLHGSSEVARESTLTFGAAVAAQIRPGLFWGGEVRYLQRYDGLAFDSLAGQAVYAGPTFYAKLAKDWWISAAWNVQIAGGKPGLSSALDLTDFERHQAKLRLGFTF